MTTDSDDILVQGPVPREDSIRARLANLAWDEGLSAFPMNGVPFSFSSGRVLAEGVAQVVKALADEPLRVLELGAGIGYLSAFCLDALQRDTPDIYAKTDFVVTDSSDALVRDAQSVGVLSRHSGRATFGVSDLRNPESILEHRPRLILMSYLIDAIPPLHLEQREDGVYAARIETRVPDGLTIVDGGCWPPAVLGSQDLASLLGADPIDLSPELARKIVPCLQETWSWERTEAAAIAGSMLNSRHELAVALCDLISKLPDDSAVLITDFGYTKSDEIELNEMMTEYGLCAFWAVAFDELKSVAESRGLATMLKAGEEGETHTLLIYKGDRGERVHQAFVAGFEEMVSDRPRFVLYNLEEDATLEDVKTAIRTIETTMPEQDVNSYGNLARFAHMLLHFGDVALATRYARRCVELYPEVAAPEMAILGSSEGRAGQLAAAEAFFNQALTIAPGCANAYLGLSGVYRAREDWDRYFESVKGYLRTGDADAVSQMTALADTLEGTRLDGVAKEARAWVAGFWERIGR